MSRPRRSRRLAGYGLSTAEIARVMGIDEDTLTAHYAASIEKGRIKANARVAESLFRKATGEGRESVTAAIFWLKTRARWKEISARDRDDDREPVVVNIRRFAADL